MEEIVYLEDEMEYQRLTKLSDMGTLHALDFNGKEQPLCELTPLDIDVLVRRLYELENKIESGELGNVRKSHLDMKAYEATANQYRIWFEEQKDHAEITERALNDCVEYYSYSALCPVLDCNYNKACWRKECTSDIVECFKIQAEKELKGESKD